MTQFLSLALCALALFLLVYGICVRSKIVGIGGFLLCLIGGYMTYYAWWGEQLVMRM